MAKKTTSAQATGTVATRHALEAERQSTNDAERARIAAETLASRKATAKLLNAKPTDSRNFDR